jgi:DNA-binding transcriptional LysR family regulator
LAAMACRTNEPWILPHPETGPESVAWPYFTEAFRASGLDVPRTGVFSVSVPLHVAMLSSGRFLAVVPRSLIWFGEQLGVKVLPVKLPIRLPAVGIVTLKKRTVSPVAKLFLACAREVAKPLVAKGSS